MQVIQAHLGDKKIIEVEHTAIMRQLQYYSMKQIQKAAVVTMDGWGDGVNHSIGY